ncbi:MAG TPA: 4-(cytidine 5'-diphospho)-2-C-methyl-D-erythritol kinase [Thermoanaerobaculia bacterium]|jgi:4-diphosphocytidyl-2-C-methyl-D-erythritol kinase
MSATLSCLAPAKVNRELRVGRLGPDGYHEVLSRIASIDLADRLTAEPAETLEFSCDDPAVPAGEDNLIVKAARLLAARAGVPPRARLRLEKRVPMGGGLGGGSADAAVTLLLLARLWRVPDGVDALTPVAAELGSDVPFFLTGGEADVAGRGERVTAAADAAERELVLLVPPFSISTAAVYRAYAGRGTLPSRLVVASGRSDQFFGPNDLASAVQQVEPRMEEYVRSAQRASLDFAISGSGSTIAMHGVTPEAFHSLADRHPEARLLRCRTLSRREYQRRTNPATPTGDLR